MENFNPAGNAMFPVRVAAFLVFFKERFMEDDHDGQGLSGKSGIDQKIEEYRQLRSLFYRRLEEKVLVSSGVQIEVAPFDPDLLASGMKWHDRRVGWNWFAVWRKFWFKPARFELAIKVDGRLCGLLLGTPSRGRRHLSLYYLESCPDKTNPLRGKLLSIAVDAINLYADILGCKYTRIVDPLPPIIRFYEGAGYVLASKKSQRPVHYEKSSVKEKP